jgi:hypothetical protein
MDHRDMTGIAAALVALVLAISGWIISPNPRTGQSAPMLSVQLDQSDQGLDRWLDRLTEPGQQVARN